MNANLLTIQFEDDEASRRIAREIVDYPMFVRNAPQVMWTSKSKSVESFQRAKRKASNKGLRLLSHHFDGDKLVAQFGV